MFDRILRLFAFEPYPPPPVEIDRTVQFPSYQYSDNVIGFCTVCGAGFSYIFKNTRRLYCNKTCSNIAYKQRKWEKKNGYLVKSRPSTCPKLWKRYYFSMEAANVVLKRMNDPRLRAYVCECQLIHIGHTPRVSTVKLRHPRRTNPKSITAGNHKIQREKVFFN